MHHASGRWGIVRADWADHPEVGVDELAVLAILSLYADRAGRCWPSQSTIAVRLGKGRAWVNRVIGRLHALGLIERVERAAEGGRRATRLYTLVGHAEAIATSASPASKADDGTPCPVADRDSGKAHEHQPTAESGISPCGHSPHGRRALGARALRQGGEAGPTVPPADWRPTADDQACALATGVDPDQFASLFVASCHAHGYRYRDHSAAYRTWLLNRWEKPNADRPARPHRKPARDAGLSTGDRAAAIRDTALAALDLLAG
jgi:DNA-binding MarR family transcriptional regulator